MCQVWEGDLFLFYCYPDQALVYAEQGYRIVDEAE